MPPKIHDYPGINLPLRYLHELEPDGRSAQLGRDFYRVGSIEGLRGVESDILQVREVAMLIVMDVLTDKANWHEKVFDDSIVAKWRREALSQDEKPIYNLIVGEKTVKMPQRTRIMSERAFDYCIAELRCKATEFKKTGLIFTLNVGQNTAIKSDSAVGDELRLGLRAAFDKLRTEQGDAPDWHPRSNDMVQDLVHPSMYPFVYGKSPFFQEEVVGVRDAVDKWSGKGEIVQEARDHMAECDNTGAFQEDGTVRFTSYINNLQPKRHQGIYRLVEKLIDKAIPAWERVLAGKAVTDANRIQKRFSPPPEVYEEDEDSPEIWEPFNPEVLEAYEKEHGEIDVSDDWKVQEWQEYVDQDEPTGLSDEEKKQWWEEQRSRVVGKVKWAKIRDPMLPEPLGFVPVTYRVKKTLREKFKDDGLQVIVKMASIELTPEKPEFPVGGWHIEGQLNEHIVATALYYLDSENVTPSYLEFRMLTSQYQEDLQERVGQDMYHFYEHIFGTRLSFHGHCLQNYGRVETPEGRLLAFPNVFQHRVSSFRLQDPTKPGHRRFIALWLVDPHQRIISTGNVPPQQLDWWAEAVFGTDLRANKGDMPPELFQLLLEQGVAKSVNPPPELLSKMSSRLPTELLDMVRREQVLPDGIMTPDEARAHRLKLMDERSAFQVKSEREWNMGNYSFCEH